MVLLVAFDEPSFVYRPLAPTLEPFSGPLSVFLDRLSLSCMRGVHYRTDRCGGCARKGAASALADGIRGAEVADGNCRHPWQARS